SAGGAGWRRLPFRAASRRRGYRGSGRTGTASCPRASGGDARGEALAEDREAAADRPYLVPDPRRCALVTEGLDAPVHQLGDLLHLALAHAARRDGRRTDPDPAGDERRAWVERDGVLVHRDAGAIEGFLRRLAGDLGAAEVDQDQVIVGPAGA